MFNSDSEDLRPKILVVDDQTWIRAFLKNVLTDLGYSICTATGTEDARSLIAGGDFDLVLTDLTMDSLGGFDVIRAGLESPSQPVVVVMTGQNRARYAVRALDQGAFDFLVKPLDSERLDLTFKRALEYRRLQAEVARLSNNGGKVLHVQPPSSSLIFYDSVTGLPNRSLFFDRLSQALLRKPGTSDCVALLIIAVEEFRRISLAHSAKEADAVLISVARNLRGLVYKRDTVARIGDNQIAVIAEMESSNRIDRLLEKVEQLSGTVSTENGKTYSVRLSIGVAFYPDEAATPEELYQHALSALDAQENLGGGGHQFYRPERDHRIRKRVRTERKLANALRSREYFIEFQPYHRLANGAVHGAEALLRWRGADGVVVPPADFVPVLEANRGIVSVTDWIIEEVAAAQQALIAEGFQDQFLSLNVSPVQFERRCDAVQLVSKIIETCPDPSHIVVEITESVFLDDNHLTTKVIDKLIENRVSIAIDDFGTGFSSLSYLTRYHTDYLKIDRSFVSGANERADAATIIAAIISMAQQLGIAVIAEGVETEGELALLRRFGCDIIQGFYYSRPQTIDGFLSHVRSVNAVLEESLVAG